VKVTATVTQLGQAGNRTNLSETITNSIRTYAWAYDKLYRLTSETVSGASPTGSLTYGLDNVGNRTSRSGSLGILGAQSLSYNTNDWLTTDVYDSDGNTRTNASNQPYLYDYEDRLTNFNNGAVLNRTSHANQGTAHAMKIKRWKSFSATNGSQNERKLAYIRLNSQTPCPPRGAVPVNTGAWFCEAVSSQHARFAFGNDCDCPSYVGAPE